jgi:hypothetical protein
VIHALAGLLATWLAGSRWRQADGTSIAWGNGCRSDGGMIALRWRWYGLASS